MEENQQYAEDAFNQLFEFVQQDNIEFSDFDQYCRILISAVNHCGFVLDLAYLCDIKGVTIMSYLRNYNNHSVLSQLASMAVREFREGGHYNFGKYIYGRQLIHHAVAYYYTKFEWFFEKLEGFKKTINDRDIDGVPPIIWAARYNNRAAVDELIKHGADVVNARIEKPTSPQKKEYSLFGDVSRLDFFGDNYFLLIVSTASAKVCDPEENNLLHLAVKAKRLDAVQYFFTPWIDNENNAQERDKPDLQGQNNEGRTPYDLAVYLECDEIIQFLKPHYGIKDTPATPDVAVKDDAQSVPQETQKKQTPKRSLELPSLNSGFSFKRNKTTATQNPLYKELTEDEYYKEFLELEVLGKLETRIIATKDKELRAELERIKTDVEKKIKTTTQSCHDKKETLTVAKSKINEAVRLLLKSELANNKKIYNCSKLVEFIKGLLLALVTLPCPFLLFSPGFRSAFYPLQVHKITCMTLAMNKKQKLLDVSAPLVKAGG